MRATPVSNPERIRIGDPDDILIQPVALCACGKECHVMILQPVHCSVPCYEKDGTKNGN